MTASSPPTLPVELTLRSRIRISKALMLLFFAQLTLGVLTTVLGYDVMKSMALFNDVVRDAYSANYYPRFLLICAVYTSFVNLAGIQVYVGACADGVGKFKPPVKDTFSKTKLWLV